MTGEKCEMDDRINIYKNLLTIGEEKIKKEIVNKILEFWRRFYKYRIEVDFRRNKKQDPKQETTDTNLHLLK